MQHRLLLLSPLLLLPLCSHASESNVTKVIDKEGLLTGVTITTSNVSLHVNVHGGLEAIQGNTKKTATTKLLAKLAGKKKAPPLKIKYYPKSMFNGNGGKVAEVNGIRIIYYPCMQNNKTLTGVTRYGSKNGLSGQFPITYNKRFQFACRSLNGNGGKVQRIGDLTFSYYPSNHDYNGGKLQRVGKITFSYYGPNSFKGKPGQLKNIDN